MDTDALIICNEENESSLSKTKKEQNNAFKGLRSILTDNPEIPDALRDLAPYFSADMRRKVVQMAALGDFMIKMSDTSAFAVSSSIPISFSIHLPFLYSFVTGINCSVMSSDL